ncbi:hypothetical protein GCM10009745_47250 [Kribbella yunnanensis]|uniref:DUF732 domain-containing protein n=1 Tax=Kribbella yunnanensis TaxID=190194 RepID=A0ABP4TYC7_9ACTN
MKRIDYRYAVVAVALAVGVLSGCSDQPAAAPKPVVNTTQQAKPTGPTGDASEPVAPTGEPAGDQHPFCAKVTANGEVLDSMSDTTAMSDAEKNKIKEQLTGLAEAAPAEIKPVMEQIATGYEKLMNGKITAEDEEEAQAVSAAVLKFGEWMTKNCTT